MTRLFKLSAFLVVVAFTCSSVVADNFSYGDVATPNFTYTNIFEATNTDGALFGAPTADGDNLDFPATGFSANATNESVDFLNGSVRLRASGNSGQTFNSVELNEFGVYFNNGDSAFSSVTTFLFVTIGTTTYSDSFSQSFQGSGSGSWSASFKIDIPDTATARIFVHNVLLAEAGAGDVASISKRDVELGVGGGGIVVPEPATAVLLTVGLMGTALRRRRS